MTKPTASSSSAEASCTNIPSLGENYIRITRHGKIKTFVKYALDFLDGKDATGNPVQAARTIVLHTLPAQIDPRTINKPAVPDAQPVSLTPTLASHALETIPRLSSVAEIIKREYIKLLEANKSTRLRGLFQYNQLRLLEDVKGVVITPDEETVGGQEVDQGNTETTTLEERRRSAQIINALSGKNHTRQVQSPYMTIVLSTVENVELVKAGATFQPPTIRKVSKNAKYRAKQREKKALESQTPITSKSTPS